MWFMNEELFVWMVIAHVAFVLLPGLFVLSYEWIAHHERRNSLRPRLANRTMRHAKVH